MRMLWREAGIAALVCGALTACASPAYPISEDQRSGPAPRMMARPAYPISEQAPVTSRRTDVMIFAQIGCDNARVAGDLLGSAVHDLPAVMQDKNSMT